MKDKLGTIVGGRSAEHIVHNNFPRGIEILLKKAKVDLDLKENERTILSHTLEPF